MTQAEQEADLVTRYVDRRDWGPTERDEEHVLRELYGPPDESGVYRGDGPDGDA